MEKKQISWKETKNIFHCFYTRKWVYMVHRITQENDIVSLFLKYFSNVNELGIDVSLIYFIWGSGRCKKINLNW